MTSEAEHGAVASEFISEALGAETRADVALETRGMSRRRCGASSPTH